MAVVQVTDIQVHNNPAPFMAPLEFEISFQCVAELADDIDFKVTWVGSADSEEYDQVLDSVLVGPVPVGYNKITLTTPPPDPALIPAKELLGVTVILLTCSYKENEFIRVGYYVHCDLPEDSELRDADGLHERKIDPNLIQRSILDSKPRVTRFPIAWDGAHELEALAEQMPQMEVDMSEAESSPHRGDVGAAAAEMHHMAGAADMME